jgi:hypothetical protein
VGEVVLPYPCGPFGVRGLADWLGRGSVVGWVTPWLRPQGDTVLGDVVHVGASTKVSDSSEAVTTPGILPRWVVIHPEIVSKQTGVFSVLVLAGPLRSLVGPWPEPLSSQRPSERLLRR